MRLSVERPRRCSHFVLDRRARFRLDFGIVGSCARSSSRRARLKSGALQDIIMTDQDGPAGAGGACDGVPASPDDPKRWRRWPSATAAEIVRRTAAGETMMAICRDPRMPGHTIVCRWMAKRPAFRQAIDEARVAAGRSMTDTSTYCRETAEAIFQRLCAGEGLIRICRDPSMPANMTVYRWMAKHEDFRSAIALAREIAAEMYFEKGWELADDATPETAYLTDVKLKHLRWHAGKLSPRRYGALRPQDPAPPHDEDDRGNLTVVIKRYTWEGQAIEGAPEEVLYKMKALPQTPQARRAEEQERAEEAREAREAARRARAAEPPNKPWDPEGWT
jgi:hypothetical protein